MYDNELEYLWIIFQTFTMLNLVIRIKEQVIMSIVRRKSNVGWSVDQRFCYAFVLYAISRDLRGIKILSSPKLSWALGRAIKGSKKIILYAGKAQNRPFRGVFWGHLTFFNPLPFVATTLRTFRDQKRLDPSNPSKWSIMFFAGITKITSQTF